MKLLSASMIRYFVAANLWLFAALIVFMGRTYERSEPTMFSVFHRGELFYAHQYTCLVLSVMGISAIFFFLAWRTRSK